MDVIHVLLLRLGNTEHSPALEVTSPWIILLSLQEDNSGCAANIQPRLFIENKETGACRGHSATTCCAQLQLSIAARKSLINEKQITMAKGYGKEESLLTAVRG